MTIDRYLASQLLVGTALVLAAVLVLLLLLEFIGEVQNIDETYTLTQAMRYIWLVMAGSAYESLPIAILIGGMLSFGSSAAQSEVIALRTTGYSRTRIILSVLSVGCLFAVFIALFGETVVPAAESAAAQVRGDDEHSGLFQKGKVGIWSREGQRFIHAREEGEGEIYLGVSIYEFSNDRRLERVIRGDSMRVESDRFVLNGVHDAQINDQGVTLSQSPQSMIERAVTFEEGMFTSKAPETMNTVALFRYINFLKYSSLRHDYHELALWKRLSQPLSALVMLLLAMPFVFAPVRSSVGQRLFYGIMIGLSYMLISNLFSNAAVAFEFAPMVGALTPLLLCLVIGLYRLSLYR